jgi:hypothetical protein
VCESERESVCERERERERERVRLQMLLSFVWKDLEKWKGEHGYLLASGF